MSAASPRAAQFRSPDHGRPADRRPAEVDEIIYDAVSDVIELHLGVNRGIVTATIAGNGEFAVRVSWWFGTAPTHLVC
jgi:hypothetical protein